MTADLTLFADPVAITAAANGLTPAFGTTLDMTCPTCSGAGYYGDLRCPWCGASASLPLGMSCAMHHPRRPPCPDCVNGQRPLPTGPFWVALATLGTEPGPLFANLPDGYGLLQSADDGVVGGPVLFRRGDADDGRSFPIRLSSAVAWARIELLPIVDSIAVADDLGLTRYVLCRQFGDDALTFYTGVGRECEVLDAALPFGTWNPGGVAVIIHDVNDKMPCPRGCDQGRIPPPPQAGSRTTSWPCPQPGCHYGHLSFPIPLPTTPDRPTLTEMEIG